MNVPMPKFASFQEYMESIKPEAAILRSLRAAKTLHEIDALRPEVVAAMKAAGAREGNQAFLHIQNSFISAQNRIRNAGGAA